MKHFFLWLFLLLCCNSFAQEGNPDDDVIVETDDDDFELTDAMRRMIHHSGLMYRVGIDAAVSRHEHAYSASAEILLRFNKPGVIFGVGILPGVRAVGREAQSRYALQASDGSHYSLGQAISSTCFAMPIYASLGFEPLHRRASPILNVRAGVQVCSGQISYLADDDNTHPYAHADLGCRVALERVSVTPFVGCSWDCIPFSGDTDPHLAFGFSIGF